MADPTPPFPPLIQVRHLPTSHSFYASLIQSLGLQYLSSTPHPPHTLSYGFLSSSPSTHSHSHSHRPTVVFELSESITPRLSHITLLAPSAKAILEFHTKSQYLNPELVGMGRPQNTLRKTEEGERAVTRDLDGNAIEAIYIPPRSSRGASGSSPAHQAQAQLPTVTIESASTPKEANRVLAWQEDVARSITEEVEEEEDEEDELPSSRRGGGAGGGTSTSANGRRVEYSQSAPRPGTFQRADTFPRVRERRGTVVGDTYRRPTEVAVEREVVREREREPVVSPAGVGSAAAAGIGGGISGNAVLGTVIATLASGALIYSALASRASAPDPLPPVQKPARRRASETHYTHSAPIRMEDRETVIERVPARSYVSARDNRGEERKTPRYVQYNVITTSTPPIVNMSRELARVEGKSYVSASSVKGRSSSRSGRRERSRSDVGSSSRYQPVSTPSPPPIAIPRSVPERDRDTQSRVSHSSRRSKHTHRERERDLSSGSSRSTERRRDRTRERERERDRDTESFMSARTHHSSSTTKTKSKKIQPPLPEVPVPPPAVPDAQSFVSTSTVRKAPTRSHVSSRDHERERERERDREREREREWERELQARESRERELLELRELELRDRERELREIERLDREREREMERAERRSHATHTSHHGGSHHTVDYARGVPLPQSELSARHGGAQLPRSMASGLGGFGGLDGLRGADGGGGPGYAASVAPSDSVSSIGVKRERERLRDRMTARGLVGRWDA